MTMSSFNGLRIIESVWLTEAGAPVEVHRTWRERLFTRPWKPWQTTRTVIPQVPMRGGICLGYGTIVMHPEAVRLLREML